MKSGFLSLILPLLLLSSLSSQAQVRLANEQEIRQSLGMNGYHVFPTVGRVKIAILDNGFGGYVPNVDLLPTGTVKPDDFPVKSDKGQPEDRHGLGMAQIIWGVTGRQPEGPMIYLLNAQGFTNFKWAVDYAIQKKVDIILYSQNWNFGGNFDGKGFINQYVNKATSSGIIWINAAGNNGGTTYTGDITTDADSGLVQLPGPQNTLRFTNKNENNLVTVTLAWSDFTDDSSYKTAKDLDIHLYDDGGNLIETTNFIQRGEGPGPAPETKDGEKKNGKADLRSAHAREEFTLPLRQGNYTLRIEDRSRNFSSSDSLRVTIFSAQMDSITFTDASNEREINIPADNPNVITVGTCESSSHSAQGPTMDGRTKPDIAIRSSAVEFNDGNKVYGSSSNAAAMFAGVVATMMAAEQAFDLTDLNRYLEDLTSSNSARCGNTPVWQTPSPAELIQFTR